MSVLDKIEKENDVRKLTWEQLEQLPEEIRAFLLTHVSRTGGHLASNLGAVELTIAIHRLVRFPRDKVVWDVGHQSYTHKILTGRKNEFEHLREYGGISGFPKRCESDADCYETGHSTTSISAALGMAQARELTGEKYAVIAVIGDGALTGGLAYEALNNASRLKSNFIIILNDNKMSISKNIGGLSTHLATLRTARRYQALKSDVHQRLSRSSYGKYLAKKLHIAKNGLKQMLVPGMIFENMGIPYLGPVDGHNLSGLVRILYEARKINGPVIVHVVTKKGKGYRPAELHPDKFHGIGAFDLETGMLLKKNAEPSYTDIFGRTMVSLGKEKTNLAAITAAMPQGTGLTAFQKKFPERFFDVGIAEEHGTVFAAGLASAGIKPVFAVYSSFLQRGYDEVIEDVCLQNLPVVFAIDRAGIVGADGETHQGIFDLSYLSSIPNMTVMAPKNGKELSEMIRYAVLEYDHPIAIRYGRGTAFQGFADHQTPIVYGKCEPLLQGRDVLIYAAGSMVETGAETVRLLKKDGISAALVNARFLKPLDEEFLLKEAGKYRMLVTMEENVLSGGFGSTVTDFLSDHEIRTEVLRIGIPDRFVCHGDPGILKKVCGIDAETAAEKIRQRMEQTEEK